MNDIEADYSKQIEDLLTKSEWRKLVKAIKVLKYNSPGEYLRLFYDDEIKFLESNEHYLKSDFIRRKHRLFSGTIQFPITDWRPLFVRKIIFHLAQPVFNRLHQKITRKEILDMNNSINDIELKMVQYTRLSNYLLRKGSIYNFYLDEMALSLAERRLNENKATVIRYHTQRSANISPFPIIELGETGEYIEQIIVVLHQRAFINKLELMRLLFFHEADTDVERVEKIKWNSNAQALFFLFALLHDRKVISKNERSELPNFLERAFLSKDNVGEYQPIDIKTVHKKINEIEKIGLNEWANSRRNSIYREINKIVTEIIKKE